MVDVEYQEMNVDIPISLHNSEHEQADENKDQVDLLLPYFSDHERVDENKNPPNPLSLYIPDYEQDDENIQGPPDLFQDSSKSKFVNRRKRLNLLQGLGSNRFIDSPLDGSPFTHSRSHMIDSFREYPETVDNNEMENEPEHRLACYGNESAKMYKLNPLNQRRLEFNTRMSGDFPTNENDGSGDMKPNVSDTKFADNYCRMCLRSNKSKPLMAHGPIPPDAPEITQEIEDRVQIELARNPDDVIARSPITNMVVNRRELGFFADREWLSDALVNFYLELIQKRSESEEMNLKVYCFGAYFYRMLSLVKNSNYGQLQSTTGNENIFLYDLVFFPICVSNHWSIVVANPGAGVLQVYNSLANGYRDKSTATRVKEFLQDEYRRKYDNQESPSTWETVPNDYVPRQNNTDDCGVFMLQYAEYLSRKQPFTFYQAHIPYFRKRMLYEVATSQLISFT